MAGLHELDSCYQYQQEYSTTTMCIFVKEHCRLYLGRAADGLSGIPRPFLVAVSQHGLEQTVSLSSQSFVQIGFAVHTQHDSPLIQDWLDQPSTVQHT